ncbi:MAG: hypothetical protein LBG15_00825 [Dysgonamonadaceae bacterium]|jgi:hypothetical protein|nr:hypothetical protein [Dysgonamonadaceae bacterium]
MENREWKIKRSPERAIINSDGQRPSEKNTVSFQSRLKACHPKDYALLELGGSEIDFILLSRQGQHVGRKRGLFSPLPVLSGTECGEHQPNHILSLTGQGKAGEAHTFYQHFVPNGTKVFKN